MELGRNVFYFNEMFFRISYGKVVGIKTRFNQENEVVTDVTIIDAKSGYEETTKGELVFDTLENAVAKGLERIAKITKEEEKSLEENAKNVKAFVDELLEAQRA